MIAAFAKGDVEAARRLNARLLESYEFESTESSPTRCRPRRPAGPSGLAVGQCRAPMGAAPPELDGEARLVLRPARRVPTGGSVG